MFKQDYNFRNFLYSDKHVLIMFKDFEINHIYTIFIKYICIKYIIFCVSV